MFVTLPDLVPEEVPPRPLTAAITQRGLDEPTDHATDDQHNPTVDDQTTNHVLGTTGDPIQTRVQTNAQTYETDHVIDDQAIDLADHVVAATSA